MNAIDRLIEELKSIGPVDRVWVQVDVAGVPHRLPLGSFQLAPGGLVFMGEPLPVPDPVVVPEGHEHAWIQDLEGELWKCVGGCSATVTMEELMGHRTTESVQDALGLLTSIVETRSRVP